MIRRRTFLFVVLFQKTVDIRWVKGRKYHETSKYRKTDMLFK